MPFRIKTYNLTILVKERKIKMDESIELLEYVYESADMGVKSTTKLIQLIHGKDNKIKKLLEDELKCYEKYYKESKHLLEKNKVEAKTKGLMAEMMAKMTMQMEVMKDNSDSKIADLLTRGFTMGEIELQKRIDSFKGEVSKDIMKLAKALLEFQQEEIKKVKKYL